MDSIRRDVTQALNTENHQAQVKAEAYPMDEDMKTLLTMDKASTKLSQTLGTLIPGESWSF
jgi:hypothetical protein